MQLKYSLLFIMSKDLKNLIDTVDKESASRNELEETIKTLKNEIIGLKFTINEQKLSLEDFKAFTKDETEVYEELPSETQILKELVVSQRKDLIRQDNKIDELNEKLDELNVESDDPQGRKSKELISSQSLVVQLSDKNEELKEKLNNLQAPLANLQSSENRTEWDFDNEVQIENDVDIVNLKRLNFQLMEANGLLRVEVESLKTELQSGIGSENSEGLKLASNKIEVLKAEIESLKTELQCGIGLVSSEELELANNKIEILKAEIDDYQAQVTYLQENIERDSEPQQTTEGNVDEFNKLKDELLEFQKQNLVLNDMLTDLKEDDEDRESDDDIYISGAYSIPTQIPLSLFNRIYSLLNTQQKRIVKNILIQDLTSDFVEVKRDTIKMLTQIKDIDIYNAFIEMIHDKDWIIRLYVIQALSKFEDKREELIDLMKDLSTDVDVDVRELAVKVLYNITRN